MPYLLQLRQVLLAVKNKRSLKVAITTLGCKVNFFDSAAMGESLRGGGFEVLPFPASADIYIINSCTVTESTDAQSRQLIGRALRMKWAVGQIEKHMREQLEMERTQKYEEIESTLPPSLRRSYVPDKYYNAPRVDNLDKYQSTDIWNPTTAAEPAADRYAEERMPDPLAVGVNV